MMERKSRVPGRVIAQCLIVSGAMVSLACGGEIPFAGKVAVAGDPPPPPPPEPPKRVEVRDNKIEIREKIQFEYNKATIKEASFDLLDEITQVIKDNPHIKKVSIEGHTDSDGSDDYNLKLSDGRSKAVLDYLVKHGIDKGRLTAKGFGESKPLVSNDTDSGKATNRRVEFNIIEQDIIQKKVEIDASGKEKVLEEKKSSPSLAKPKD